MTFAQLGRAIRFRVCVTIVLGTILFHDPRNAWPISPAFEGIFRDMLNGKPLPPLTNFRHLERDIG